MLVPPASALVDVFITLNGEGSLDDTHIHITGDRTLGRHTGSRYRFGLPIGGTYVCTPVAPGYVFSPASVH
jgi:hypothetical protein